MGQGALVVLFLAGIFFAFAATFLSKILIKVTKNDAKVQAYECGIPAKGTAWIQFSVGYYLFALIFLVFDVELVFLYPWAVIAKTAGWAVFAQVMVFLFILFLGLLYAHKKGALKWM